MQPTAPETGYGYIEIGDPLPDAGGVYGVARFLEKPDAGDGRAVRRQPAGICGTPACSSSPPAPCCGSWRPTRPPSCPPVRQSVADRQNDLDFIRLGVEAFKACPSISIDYAVAERTSPRGRGAGRAGLVRRGKLERAVGARRQGRRRQRRARRCPAGGRGELLRPQRRDAGRGRRPEGRRGGGDRGRGAGDAPQPGPGRQEDRRSPEGRAAGSEAVAHNRMLSAVGLLREPDPGRAVPGQAHRGQPGAAAVAAKPFPSRRALGRGERHRPGDARRRNADRAARTKASICRWAASTAWKTPARSR